MDRTFQPLSISRTPTSVTLPTYKVSISNLETESSPNMCGADGGIAVDAAGFKINVCGVTVNPEKSKYSAIDLLSNPLDYQSSYSPSSYPQTYQLSYPTINPSTYRAGQAESFELGSKEVKPNPTPSPSSTPTPTPTPLPIPPPTPIAIPPPMQSSNIILLPIPIPFPLPLPPSLPPMPMPPVPTEYKGISSTPTSVYNNNNSSTFLQTWAKMQQCVETVRNINPPPSFLQDFVNWYYNANSQLTITKEDIVTFANRVGKELQDKLGGNPEFMAFIERCWSA